MYIRYGGPPRFGGGGGGGGGGNRGGPSGKFGNPGERLRKKHWNLDELPKFQKNFYQEHPDVTHRSPVRFRIYFVNNSVNAKPISLKKLLVFFSRFSKRLNNTEEAKK